MRYMVTFLAAVVLVALATTALVLEKTYFYVPLRELKRQAARHGASARALYPAAAYETELKIFLWLVIGLSAAGGFLLFARVAPPELGFIVIAFVLLLAFVWVPRTRLTTLGARLARRCTPSVVWVMRVLHPVLRYGSLPVARHYPEPHTGLYEHEDLHELLKRQQAQSDNRISDHDLALMRRALQFGEYRVHGAMTPRGHVVAVAAEERISPVLLDELHKSGHSYFPVYAATKSDLVGTLPLDMVADVKREGAVRDFFDRRLAYVHERDRLEQALLALYETGQHLLIVVDNAGEYIGIITLGDVLQCLFGAIQATGPGRHEDRQMVAARYRRPAEADDPVSQNSTEVVQ